MTGNVISLASFAPYFDLMLSFVCPSSAWWRDYPLIEYVKNDILM